MSNNGFYWLCKVLKWSTKLSWFLMMLIILLIPFAFIMADEKPWAGLLGFTAYVGWFAMNFRGKNSFIKGERVCRGTLGTTGVMFPLWQNIVFWFLYISMEFLMAGVAISAFAKAIWPS